MSKIANFMAAIKASFAVGKASKMHRLGRDREALRFTRKGLSALSDPRVNRFIPYTASNLIVLTSMCEKIAHDLNKEGADTKDLEDTHRNIIRIYGHNNHSYVGFLKYIEDKLGYVPNIEIT